jgi:hypothetical protein
MSDYAEHLVAARKALSNAEAFAALHQWRKAHEALMDVHLQADLARYVILLLDKPKDAGAK